MNADGTKEASSEERRKDNELHTDGEVEADIEVDASSLQATYGLSVGDKDPYAGMRADDAQLKRILEASAASHKANQQRRQAAAAGATCYVKTVTGQSIAIQNVHRQTTILELKEKIAQKHQRST